ncbi:unnamed protein product [Amoebophrya sp. A120]|nr:unnamed protein product [Amoebophrya sp. A120]|eukprot:GSA120T00025666001.1
MTNLLNKSCVVLVEKFCHASACATPTPTRNTFAALHIWMQKWISPHQRFNWHHKRDADNWNPRDAPPPMESNSGKLIAYNGSKAYNHLFPEKQLQRSDSAPQFPARNNWKVNKYGPKEPARLGGGISSWQPSHSDVLWGYPKGFEKWNKGSEMTRILNPAPTTGVLQYRGGP